MTKKKAVAKRAAVPAPQNLNEAAEYVRQIGEAERAIDRANTDMNARIEEVKQPFVEEAKEHQQTLADLVEGLYAFANGRRAELTDQGERKTVTVPTGSFGWRVTPKSIGISDPGAVVKQLKALGLTRFLRVKVEPDKAAMLKEEEVAAAVEGVTVQQHEEFVVKPAQATAEVAATQGKRKLKLVLSAGPRKEQTKKSA